MRNGDNWKYVSVGKIFSFLVYTVFPLLFSPIFFCLHILFKNASLGASWKKKITLAIIEEMKAARELGLLKKDSLHALKKANSFRYEKG